VSRGLPVALAAVAIAAPMVVAVAGCGNGKAHNAARTTTATNPFPASTAGAAPRQTFVVYAKPTRAQFVNHADDRARGDKLKSFNAEALPTPPNANSGKKGARAGDNALVSLTLYADPDLTQAVGTATYSCTFNFAQEAICDGHFELGGGTILALGPAKLDGSEIVLAVTGGTGRYAGAHGQVTSTSSSAKKNTRIFRFILV
jgi:hypothetical protein